MFIVARGNAPGIENEANRFGQRPYSIPSTRIEYGRWPKNLRVFRIPGALPQAMLKEAVGHKAKQRIFLAYASGYQVFKQHQFVLAALGYSLNFSVPDNGSYLKLRRLVCEL